MSDKPTQMSTVLEALPRDTRDIFVDLLDEPPMSLTQLRRDIEAYMELVEEKSYEYEFMDTVSARLIARDFLEFLERTPDDLSEFERKLLQAGVRYFVENDDAEDDFTSPIGFDDDTQVKDVVLEFLTDK